MQGAAYCWSSSLTTYGLFGSGAFQIILCSANVFNACCLRLVVVVAAVVGGGGCVCVNPNRGTCEFRSGASAPDRLSEVSRTFLTEVVQKWKQKRINRTHQKNGKVINTRNTMHKERTKTKIPNSSDFVLHGCCLI